MKTCMLYKDVRIYTSSTLEQMPVVGEVREVGTGMGPEIQGPIKKRTGRRALWADGADKL